MLIHDFGQAEVIDPTEELTISEIVSREIDPVLFVLLLTADNFLKRNIGKLTASYAVNN